MAEENHCEGHEGHEPKKARLQEGGGGGGGGDARGCFVFSGGTGYAAAVNGTYQVVPEECAGGKPVYRQIENPLWWFEYAKKWTDAECRVADREDGA